LLRHYQDKTIKIKFIFEICIATFKISKVITLNQNMRTYKQIAKVFFPIFKTYFYLKGQCHEIFDFWFFSWISFPQASECTITAISNFFENSRRYSRLKVQHRCQRHRWQKIFKQKNFNNFVWAPLGSRVNIYLNFCLQVHFKVSAARYCSHFLPPVSTTPVANLPPVSFIPVAICHRRR
jgi:hypothetical protein